MTSFSRRAIRFLFVSLCICAVVLSWESGSAYGQISFFGGNTTVETGLPQRNIIRYGELEVTWIKSPISGKRLFQIASPTVADRSDAATAQTAVEVRAKNIEDLLWLEVTTFRERAISQLLKGNSADESAVTQPVKVSISDEKDSPAIQISHSARDNPLTLVTVTPSDVNFYSKTSQNLAREWQSVLQAEIGRNEAIYAPQSLSERIKKTLLIVFVLLMLTGCLVFVRRWLAKRQQRLREQYTAESAVTTQLAVEREEAAEATGTTSSSSLTAQAEDASEHHQLSQLFSQQLTLLRQLDVYQFARWLLFWLIVLSWYLGVYFATTQLPSLMRWSRRLLIQPLSLIIIWFMVSLLIRISNVLIERSLNAWKENSYLSFGDVRRKSVRSQTIAGALKGLATSVLLLLGVLLTLVDFGLPASSIFAGSAVLGIALSFGAQSLIKDLVNGCLILLEDQFAVGDWIFANDEYGLVETLNLRLTQLRSPDGELISIPNSSITKVKNQTSSWSRVNLGINVAYETDLDKAISVINETALQMSRDPGWQALILAPPQVLGVDAFGENSMTIRLWMRTQPLQKLPVGRELRRRLKQAFDQAGISIPFPQRSIWFENTIPAEERNS